MSFKLHFTIGNKIILLEFVNQMFVHSNLILCSSDEFTTNFNIQISTACLED